MIVRLETAIVVVVLAAETMPSPKKVIVVAGLRVVPLGAVMVNGEPPTGLGRLVSQGAPETAAEVHGNGGLTRGDEAEA